MTNGKEELIEDIVAIFKYPPHFSKLQDPKAWDNLALTKEQLRLLSFIFFKGQSSPGAIADHFGVSKANVTSVIDKLVQKRLLGRKENLSDRRSLVITITNQGKEQMYKLREMHAAQVRNILKHMNENDLTSLAQGLKAFTKVIKERGN